LAPSLNTVCCEATSLALAYPDQAYRLYKICSMLCWRTVECYPCVGIRRVESEHEALKLYAFVPTLASLNYHCTACRQHGVACKHGWSGRHPPGGRT
jgi:hypothetical protein